MDDSIRAGLSRGGTIDITTTGRRTGRPRRIEIVFHRIDGRMWISGLPSSRKRAWLANLEADPRLTVHLKGPIATADLPATARVVIGAIDSAPIIITNAAELFGGRIAGDYKDRFDAHVADVLLAKAGVSNAAHRHIHVNVLRRAVREAAA